MRKHRIRGALGQSLTFAKHAILSVPIASKLKPRSISRQIGYGYLVAIAVGWIGSGVGIVIADYFQGKGVFQLLDAQTQIKLLSSFERSASAVDLQVARALLLADNPEQLEEALSRIRLNLAAVTTARQNFENFLPSNSAPLVQDAETINTLLTAYEVQLNQYADQVFADQRINNSASPPELADISGQLAALEALHSDLVVLIQLTQAQETSTTETMESLQGFEKLVIAVSLVLSGLLAGAIAWRTTRAIAQPIENITQVARQVAQEDDYSLRASGFRQDEMGDLARSLNDLIERVAERTRSLEQTAQSAERQNQELANALNTLRHAQAQLIQSEKMSSLGQLVAGIAHEVNNPIGFIQGNLQYAQEYSEALFEVIDHLLASLADIPDDVQKCLDAADVEFIRRDLPKVLQSLTNGVNRINRLVESLRVFSRLQESQLKCVHLHEGIESVLLLLGHRFKPQAKRPEVAVMYEYGNFPEVECYSGQLNQVFMHILSNALDAIDERWASTTDDWQPTLTIYMQQIGDRVQIQLSNNGVPVPDAIQDKIFDPFFTTKPVGQGMGLGMSISYEIIEKHHRGTLTFISPVKDGFGTQFTIEIPMQQSLQLVMPRSVGLRSRSS
ncbi:MAG: ATP-binding protein [Cyanobacteria bacterium P01_H01_bin.58]